MAEHDDDDGDWEVGFLALKKMPRDFSARKKKSERNLFFASVGKYLRSDRISDDNLKHRDINFVYFHE